MNIDEKLIEKAISDKTKAIVVVHYGGVACEMDEIMKIARKHRLLVIEDAAQALMSKYKNKYLGTIGDIGCISFHETKNVSCGEGGALLINKKQFISRAEIVREKGTDRSRFFRGEVDKYTWVDIGSSYLPSELNAAFLYAQLLQAVKITNFRRKLWSLYRKSLAPLEKEGFIDLQTVPKGCLGNGHIFFIKTRNLEERVLLINFLKRNGIMAVFHYIPLHSSLEGRRVGSFSGKDIYTTRESERILRLPMYYGLKPSHVKAVCQNILDFYLIKQPTLEESDRIEINLDRSVFTSVIAISLGIIFFTLRIGFGDNSFWNILSAMGLSMFLIFLPNTVDSLKLRLNCSERWFNSPEFIFISGLVGLVVAGLISSVLNLGNMFSILGFIFFIANIRKYFGIRTKSGGPATVFALAILLSLAIAGVLWGSGLWDPLFLEKMVLGHSPIDPLFHSSISNMIKTHLVPSTGLDGVPYLKYHWGSHYIFAQLARLLRFGAMDFYNFAYPIILAPFLVRSMIYLIDRIREAMRATPITDWRFYTLIIIAFTGVIPLNYYSKLGIFLGDVLVSESYALGVCFTCILLAIIFSKKKWLLSDESSGDKLSFLFLFLPLMLGLIGLLKVSIFLLILVLFAYFFIRLQLFRKRLFIFSALFCLTISAVVYHFSYSGDEIKFFFLHYVTRWVSPEYRLTYPLTNFFWVWCYFLIKLEVLGVGSPKDFFTMIKERKALDLEFLILVSVAGALPGAVLFIPAGGAFFFSDLHRWLAICFVIAGLSNWWPRKLVAGRGGFSSLLFFPTCITLLIATGIYFSLNNIDQLFIDRLLLSNIKTRYQLVPQQSELPKVGHFKYIHELILEKKSSLLVAAKEAASLPSDELEKNKRYQLLKFLKFQQSINDEESTAVYIPQNNFFYWGTDAYINTQFLVPSLAGMPMIGGVQPYIPDKLTEKSANDIIVGFTDGQKQTFLNYYEKEGEIFVLKGAEELNSEEKIEIYDLISPHYYKELRYYGFWSYPAITEMEYLNRFSGDRKICEYALEKKFTKVLIIKSDKDNNSQAQTLSCVE